MNWGWKIVVLYSLFVIMTLTMVFYFMRQKVDLVAEDYYKQEIEYQDQIDKINNARSLKEPVGFQVLSKDGMIQLTFPKAHIDNGIKGEVQLYRPSDAGMDKRIAINPGNDGVQNIGVGSLKKGLWRVKISWKSAGKDYYDERVLTL